MSLGGRNGSAAKAIVIGGSIGGLFAANMLLRRGWEVDVYERVPGPLSARGTGIARHPEMKRLMAEAGADDGQGAVVAVAGRTAYGRSGARLDFYAYPQQLAAWSQVFLALKRAFPAARYHSGRDLVAAEQDEAGVTARFADGGSARADVLIGADGFRSAVRTGVAPAIRPDYCGYVAWRGMVEKDALSESFVREHFDRYAFCFPTGGQFIGYSIAVDGAEAGGRRYNFLWYAHVAAGAALDDLLTDPGGVTHRYSIPPTLIRPEHLARLKQDAGTLLPDPFAEVVLKTRQSLLQPIYDVDSERMSFGRIALAGDAAFVARPHVGTGVLKAGLDARSLAACLAEGPTVPAALRRYEAMRVPPNRETVALGRYLGSFIERGLPGPEADPDLRLDIPKILRLSARPTHEVQELMAS